MLNIAKHIRKAQQIICYDKALNLELFQNSTCFYTYMYKQYTCLYTPSKTIAQHNDLKFKKKEFRGKNLAIMNLNSIT